MQQVFNILPEKTARTSPGTGGHVIRSPTGKVQCPVLRVYSYPVCTATGDNAHTLKYCPKNKGGR